MSDAATITPEARLAIALTEWRAHAAEIATAYDEQDYASVRVLEEHEIGFLNDVADAADALMVGQVAVTIHVEDSYATGEEFARRMTVAVPVPADGQDNDDWAQEHLLRFSGQGPAFAHLEALYEVTVTDCDARPELIGVTASAQG